MIRRRALAPGVALCALLLIAGAGPTATAVTADTPDDPLFAEQYGPQQVRAPGAWSTSTGEGTTIAIVDSGIDLDHPDLDAKVLPGNTFLDCGAAGCGDGDWESGPEDRQQFNSFHGTHVAGIAAAETANGEGVAGVAPDAQLLAVKVLDDEGGSFEDIALGVRYAVDHGADVINLSLGALPGVQALTFTGVITDLTDAIGYATDNGVVVVAAAGNESVPLCDTPGFDPGVLCVGATDRREAPSFYSNFPVNPDSLGVRAPGGSLLLVLCGEGILSTVPIGSTAEICEYGPGYYELDGTSMAAPHVAGVAALLAAQGRDRAGIIDAITSTARNPVTGSVGSFEPVYGYGIVDAEAAVATPVTGGETLTPNTRNGDNGDGGNRNGKGGPRD